ncbi:hypothetical protein M9Y10_033528 [Tritrichomonas musculus]|uniref:Myb-like DNA-binding domain containing protein n=1 Tax=Tritrichomonas musculus TaxID=1915356 RepID=A0ABR2KCD0_9EUKA
MFEESNTIVESQFDISDEQNAVLEESELNIISNYEKNYSTQKKLFPIPQINSIENKKDDQKENKKEIEDPKNLPYYRKKFSFEEDQRLRMIVQRMGSKKWDQIAKYMPGRSGRQCRDRYQNYLIPGFFNGQWTKEEDELLIKKHNEFGSKWSKMTIFFKNRNANSIKNRWNYFLCKYAKDNEPNENKKEKSIQSFKDDDYIAEDIFNEFDDLYNCTSAFNIFNFE